MGRAVKKYPERMATAALLTLPDNLVLPGTSGTAAGVEVPLGYAKPLPAGYDTVDLPPCTMLFFRGAPFEDPNDYRLAIDIVQQALTAYRPGDYGWRYAHHAAPRFNFGTICGGALMAVPVERAD